MSDRGECNSNNSKNSNKASTSCNSSSNRIWTEKRNDNGYAKLSADVEQRWVQTSFVYPVQAFISVVIRLSLRDKLIIINKDNLRILGFLFEIT